MGTERQVMQEYLDALFKRTADYSVHFTDDVVATIQGTDRRAEDERRLRSSSGISTGTRSTRMRN